MSMLNLESKINDWIEWLVSSRVGHVLVITAPLLSAAPFVLGSSRYASIARLAFLLAVFLFGIVLHWIIARHRWSTAHAYKGIFGLAAALYALIVLGIVYGLRFSNYALAAGLASEDTAIFEQAFWNTTHANGLLVSTLEGGSHLAVHNSPFLVVLAGGYILFPGTLYLFSTQTLAVLVSGWALYTITRKNIPALPALMLAMAFLLHPLTLANQFYFHETFFAAMFLLLSALFILEKHWARAIIAIGLLLTVSERSALLVLGLAVVMWFSRAPRKWVLGSLALATVSLVSTPIVLNAFRTSETLAFSFFYFRHLGTTPGEMFNTLTGDPFKLFYPLASESSSKFQLIYGLFAPLFFILPFASIWILPILPEAVFNLLASGLNDLSWHYATILAGLYLSTALALGKWFAPRPLQRRTQLAMLTAAILVNTLALLPVTLNPESFVVNSKETTQMQRAMNVIPESAALCADVNLIQYFARRAVLYSNQSSPIERLRQCHYIILDRQNPHRNESVLKLLADNPTLFHAAFEVVLSESRILVLRRAN